MPNVVIIAFDSMDYSLTRTWALDGHMPNFRALFEQSRWGLVDNPTGVEAGSAWPSFTTGFMPDHHGFFQAPYRFDVDSYKLRVIDLSERPIDPIWVDMSEAGKRVAVVDAPYELLEERLNGVQVTNWLAHVFTRYPGLATHPPELAEELERDYGTNPFEGPNRCPTNDCPVDTAGDVTQLRDRLLERVGWKLSFSQDLLRREQWDYFLTVFHDAHDIGHMCWHVHDPEHERHDPSVAESVGDPVLDVYVALDAALGSLLESVGPDVNVIVYSSHGIGPQRTGSFFLDDILKALDEAYRRDAAATSREQSGLDITSLYASAYRAVVPKFVRRGFSKTSAMRKVYKHARMEELKRRRFFEVIPNHATGGVRLNLKGRERHGVVEPGRESEALCRRLEEDLKEIVNVESGEPVISTVFTTARLYDGPLVSEMPDLLLEWNRSAPIDCVHSPKFGTLRRRSQSTRSGDHANTPGMFLALGPGIRPGRRNAPVSAADFAPTIAALLGHDGAYQGSPIRDLCGPDP